MHAANARSIELPPRWIAFLRPYVQSVGGLDTIEVTTLPAALAFGAPPRVTAVLEIDKPRARLGVTAALVGGRVVPIADLHEEPWGAYWLASVTAAIEAEVRRRGATRPGIPSTVRAAVSIRPPAPVSDEIES